MAAALEGIKVIETASAMAGPMAGRLLADWGADVVHIENPATGDMLRSQRTTMQSMVDSGLARDRSIQSDIDYSTQNHNCNKKGMTLDLSQDSGRQILYKMLESADVFLNNFRARELKKFNLEYETLSKLNPKLICANLTGWGPKGPDQDLPGYDYIAFWARAGILQILMTPEMEPFTTPGGLGDRVTSLNFALGIMTALFTREKTGMGQEVNVSIYNTGVFVNCQDVGGSLVTGKDRQNVRRDELPNVLLNSYKTKDDRWVRLAVNQPDRYWPRVCQAIEREDLVQDPRFEAFAPRIENRLDLFKILEDTFKTKTMDEWTVRLNEAGLPWARVSTLPEVCSDPQARENDFYTSLEHPTYGSIEVVATPVKLSKTPGTVRMPAPELGQHTEEVLLEYGFTWENIAQFKDQGVIA